MLRGSAPGPQKQLITLSIQEKKDRQAEKEQLLRDKHALDKQTNHLRSMQEQRIKFERLVDVRAQKERNKRENLRRTVLRCGPLTRIIWRQSISRRGSISYGKRREVSLIISALLKATQVVHGEEQGAARVGAAGARGGAQDCRGCGAPGGGQRGGGKGGKGGRQGQKEGGGAPPGPRSSQQRGGDQCGGCGPSSLLPTVCSA